MRISSWAPYRLTQTASLPATLRGAAVTSEERHNGVDLHQGVALLVLGAVAVARLAIAGSLVVVGASGA